MKDIINLTTTILAFFVFCLLVFYSLLRDDDTAVLLLALSTRNSLSALSKSYSSTSLR